MSKDKPNKGEKPFQEYVQGNRPTDSLIPVLLDQVAGALVLEDAKEGLIYVNEGAIRLLEREPDDLLGRPWAALVHPSERERVERFHLDIFQGVRDRIPYYTNLHGNEPVPVSITVTTLILESRPLAALRISEARREGMLKRLLQESESRYRDFVENAHEIMIMLNSKGQITSVNRAFEVLLGYSRREAMGMPLPGILSGVSEAHARSLHEALWKKGSVVVASFLRTTSGESVPVEITATAVTDDVGRILGGRIVARPMEDRLDGVIHLIKQERLATISELLQGATHELNNPLAGIIGNAEMLLLDESDGRKREVLEELVESAHRCRKAVDGMKQLSRRGRDSKGVIDLNRLLRAALEQLRSPIEENQVRIEMDLSETPLPVEVAPAVVQQELLHLLETSVLQASEQGRYGVVWCTTRLEDGLARLEIADNGPSLPSHQKRYAWDPYRSTTADRGAPRQELGLSVASGVISSNGGQLFEATNTRNGNSVVVLLPLVGGGSSPA